jgi:hypothetical protein
MTFFAPEGRERGEENRGIRQRDCMARDVEGIEVIRGKRGRR